MFSLSPKTLKTVRYIVANGNYSLLFLRYIVAKGNYSLLFLSQNINIRSEHLCLVTLERTVRLYRSVCVFSLNENQLEKKYRNIVSGNIISCGNLKKIL